MTDAPLRNTEYRPDNYEGRYYGNVSLETAIAKSLNSVAVRLAERVGYPQVREMAARLGIESPLTQHPSLVLGTSEVRLMELTAAYAALANGGRRVQPYGITEIRDREGRVLYTPAETRQQGQPRVLAPAVVEKINRMLHSVLASGTGRRADFGRDAAGKTGTTQNYRDAWFVGYTPDLVAGIWAGNDDNSPVAGMTGGSLPATLWGAFMRAAHEGIPRASLPGLRAPKPPPVSSRPAPPSQQNRNAEPEPRETDKPGWDIRQDFRASDRNDP